MRARLRSHVRAGIEDRPGVYRILGEDATVLYVGKSKRLRARLLSYCRLKGRRRDRQARIIRHAHHVEWEYHPSEFAALLRELRLIKELRPRFNRVMNEADFPRGYVALTSGPVPGLRVVPRSDDPGADLVYGPFRNPRHLADLVHALAEATGVRDCLERSQMGPPDSAPGRAQAAVLATSLSLGGVAGGKRRLAGCLRFELGTCPGPCVGAAHAPAYAAGLGIVRDFLAGRDDAPLRMAREAMLEAAGRLEFERAGAFKRRVGFLEELSRRLASFHASVDRLTFTYRVTGGGAGGSDRCYLIRRGTVRAEVDQSVGETPDDMLRREQRRVFEGGEARELDIPAHDLDELYLVASWFRRNPGELTSTMKWSRTVTGEPSTTRCA